ncbi:hypothetical protein FALBO_10713 [Fusarium albosuccineum]|uniref:Adhesin domain-containing protein n=1 Tax=Fusarium albosuccineum TaxID=1237068 RepID=A0A8H4L3X1_9HYPO|nr:hypothetical protein FALBO_10713 [Fusarium albosuccineum]
MPAPYSDNLYSADSSDDEPDALSPTDGYFHASSSGSGAVSSSSPSRLNVPHVPNVLVEDPTLPSRESKARELERERNLSSTGGSGQAPGSGYQLRQSVEDESSFNAPPSHAQQPLQLFAHHVDAPPAYTPSPTSPSTSNNYQTFTPSTTATMGRAEEQQPLVSHGPPESMSSPPDSNKPSRLQIFKNRLSNINFRRKFKTILGVLVIFSVISAIIGSLSFDGPRPRQDPDDLIDHDPVKPPSKEHDDFTWSPSPTCLDDPHRFARITTALDLRYTRNLSILQTVDNHKGHSGWSPHISGEVVLRAAEGSSAAHLELEVISNHEGLSVEVDYDKETQLLKMTTPARIDWELADKAPCIQIRATIWAPRESVVKALAIDTLHLNVDIKEGLILGAADGVVIRSTVGHVKSPALDAESKDKKKMPYTLSSREIRVHTTSGNIDGWYPLYDLLDIESVSGDISTGVGPKPVDPQEVKSATLRVRSGSGKISVDEPLDQAVKAARPDRAFPPRDYIVDLLTASGDITADVAASSFAKFGSQSGDLKIRVWPVLDSGLLTAADDSDKPVLETDTKSGDSEVTVLEPLWTSLATIGETIPPLTPKNPEDEPYLIMPPRIQDTRSDKVSVTDTPALSVLSSKHKSISGRVTLRYPSSWEGYLFAQTISGKQDFRGKDLQLTHEGGAFTKLLKGRKGNGYSQLDVRTVSGDEDALIGKEA